MNYYDEFGLAPRASMEEIKDAYRALVRLLHPDHQQDLQLQQMAEHQIKKLNSIYAVLSDPERRRQYDREQSQAFERSQPIIIHAPPPQRSFVNGSSLAWITAVGFFIVLLIWMASRPAPSGPIYVHESGASLADQSARPEPAEPAPANSPAAVHQALVPPVPASQQPAPENPNTVREADALRLRLVQAMNDRDSALNEVARLQVRLASEKSASQRSVASQQPLKLAEQKKINTPAPELKPEQRPPAKPQPDAALAARANLPAPPELPAPRNAIAGSWFYRQPAIPPKNKDLYPPEFIETTISEENGQLRGTYHARYHIPDRPVSPDVNFQFAGKVYGDAGSVPWSGTGGSRGEVSFKLTADHSLRVDWTASQLGTLGFYRGTAILVKRSD